MAGQLLLLVRRQQQRAERLAAGNALRTDAQGRRLVDDAPEPMPCLPAHLGWGSRRGNTRQPQRVVAPIGQEAVFSADTPSTAPPATPSPASPPPTLTLQPDLALALLRCNQTAAGRVWLLLRRLDIDGRGWVTLAEARAQLTAPDAVWRICGWRQLRNLLRQGDGLFWQIAQNRLWLRATAKVAHGLGLSHLTGKPVALPIQHLLGRIGAVRAYLYAAFHSGRPARPIARATLTRLSGVSQSAQRQYEARCGVRSQAMFALGRRDDALEREATAWRRGRSLFKLTDTAGRHGPRQAAYLAWRLPNSYRGIHTSLTTHSRRRLNRRLAGLEKHGTPGNSRQRRPTRFFEQGAMAAQANRRETVYWRGPGQTIWYALEPSACSRQNPERSWGD